MKISLRSRQVTACAALAFGMLQCGSGPEPPPSKPTARPPGARAGAQDAPTASAFGAESWDGVTCEAARDAHPDEVGVGAKRVEGPEPSDAQYSAPLATGTYLDECEVPQQTRVTVCAAILDGKAVGVTVATSPEDGEKERCV